MNQRKNISTQIYEKEETNFRGKTGVQQGENKKTSLANKRDAR